jgi:hypothetical protein
MEARAERCSRSVCICTSGAMRGGGPDAVKSLRVIRRVLRAIHRPKHPLPNPMGAGALAHGRTLAGTTTDGSCVHSSPDSLSLISSSRSRERVSSGRDGTPGGARMTRSASVAEPGSARP